MGRNNKKTGKRKNHDQHNDSGPHPSNGRPVAYQMAQSTVAMSRTGFNKFPSDAIPANALGISTQFDTRWPGSLVDSLQETSLEITILNNSNANVATFTDPSVWFPRIEVLSNGAVADVVLYDIMFYVDKMTRVSDEQRAQYANGNIYNPVTFRSYGNEPTSRFPADDNPADAPTHIISQYQLHNYDASLNLVAAASSTIVVRAKYKTFLTDAKIFFPALSVEPRLRIYTGNNIQTTTSAAVATTPTLVSINTYLRGTIYDPDVRAQLYRNYMSRVSLTRTVVYERQTFALQINSGVQVTDQLLTAITGTYSWLFVIVSQAAPSQNQLYSDYDAAAGNGAFWKKLSDITLLDSNQRPWNFTNIPTSYLQNEVWGDHWQSAMTFEKEIYLIPFSECCQLTRDKGVDNGTMYFDGNWTLRFTPQTIATYNAIPANMSVTLIVLGARVCTFSQLPKGGVSFTRI